MQDDFKPKEETKSEEKLTPTTAPNVPIPTTTPAATNTNTTTSSSADFTGRSIFSPPDLSNRTSFYLTPQLVDNDTQTDSSELIDNDTQTNSSKMSVRIPNPVFDEANVEAWFLAMEYWFKAMKITEADEQCDFILANLQPSTLMKLKPMVDTMPATNKMTFLKKTIIDNFTESQQKRLNKLLSAMPLGDQKPSELYVEMKRVAGDSINEPALKGLWSQRLPDHARAAVAASTATPDEYTKIADAIVEAMQMKTINQISSSNSTVNSQSTEIQELRAEISQLTKLVNEKFNNYRGRSKSRGRNRSRSSSKHRSDTPSNTDSEQCWYHRKFGNDAKNCRSPCNFKRSSSNNTNA